MAALGLAEGARQARMHPIPPLAKFAAFELGDWVFVISPDHRFASRERVAALSQTGPAIGAYLEEHVMISGAFGGANGRLVWSAQHDPEVGDDHLDVWGEPPAALSAIQAKLLQDLKTNNEADYLFDAPIELAATVCGFDPNRFDEEVVMIELTVARSDLMKLRDHPLASEMDNPGEARPAESRSRPGLFARLLGKR